MNDEHREWLNRLEQESRQKRQTFMANISERLGRPQKERKPEHPYRGAPDYWHSVEWDREERIERFADHFSAVGGYAVRVPDMDGVTRFVVDTVTEMKAKRILRHRVPELEALALEAAFAGADGVCIRAWNSDPAENWKAHAAEADIGIVVADYAAAYTGSIAVLSSAEKGRSVSLLPTALIVVIPADRIRTRLGEILRPFDRAGESGLPAGIHFISGPSRSADIENDLTIGVHGPGIVYALIVG